MDGSWVEASDDSPVGVSVQNLSGQPLPDIERTLNAIPAFVLDQEGQLPLGEIAIVLTTDEHLASLHAEHLNDGSVTDVMTFPYFHAGEPVSGDIVISVDRAREQAGDEGWSLGDELSFIAIHGMLHLCGWDDQTDEARQAMHQRQHEILGQFVSR
ncbi:MAG: rRNA maturation RNase YbeY [Thermomicrobiales bacterium]|nr:rRNA maturation RNase YbeY [Thermomicrobiales bacterium]